VGINWIPLESASQIHHILRDSASRPAIIYKHSTRCGVSGVALGRLERASHLFAAADCYFLDLIHFRHISNLVAETFSVEHESPQLIVIIDGKMVEHVSHYGIEPTRIGNYLSKSRNQPSA
jgi:bacillithiol system protein YtxJ